MVWRRSRVPLALLALLVAGWALARRPPAVREVGGQPLPNAPAFVLETLDGRGELGLSDLRGKPVVLNFWASWCAPCRLEVPVLVEAWRKSAGRVHFLGVNVLDDRAAAVRFAADVGMRFPSVRDPEGDVLRWFRVVGLPTTVFVTRHGRILEVHPGPFVGPEGRRDLERRIHALEER